MRSKVEHPLAVIAIFIWIGAVLAISFLEAWLKFQAPGVTLAIGLGIGKLVFAALTKFQWILTVVVVASISFGRGKFSETSNLLIYFVIGLLLLQTFWLLPLLDQRANLVITGKNMASSNLHIYFIVAEILKVLALMIAGILNFKKDR